MADQYKLQSSLPMAVSDGSGTTYTLAAGSWTVGGQAGITILPVTAVEVVPIGAPSPRTYRTATPPPASGS